MNYISDWDVSDSSLPSYIKNKPDIPTIQDLIDSIDISQLSDSQNLITTHRSPINPQDVVADGNGKFYLQLGKRHPTELITFGTMYSIEPDSLSIDQNNVLTI